MKTVYLPALNTKKEANTIKITNSKLEGVEARPYNDGVTAVPAGKDSTGTIIEVPAQLFGYNEFESLSEFVADCGGEEKALEMVNDFKRGAALDDAKVAIRTTTNVDIDSVVASAIKAALDHTFSGANKISGREAKEIVNDLRATAANLTDAELAAQVRKLMGL